MPHLYSQQDTLYIGCMTGTSVDAVADFTVTAFDAHGLPLQPQHLAMPLPTSLQHTLSALSTTSSPISARNKASAEQALSLFLADAYQDVITHWGLHQHPQNRIILSPHGQTICHQPEKGITEQLLNAALLAEKTQYRVVHQHRTECIQISNAAPLAPVLLRQLFQHRQQTTIIINGGGIANITLLPSDQHGAILGYDIGPANGPLDSLMRYFVENRPTELPAHMRHAQFDPNGELAASGQRIAPLYQQLLADEYFKRPIQQKSADRSQFNLQWIQQTWLDNNPVADLCHTVTIAIATTIADAIKRHLDDQTCQLFFYGGIRHNHFLLQAITEQLTEHPRCQIASLKDLGFHPDYIESLLMAYLGYCVHQQQPIDLAYCSTRSAALCIPGRLVQPKQ